MLWESADIDDLISKKAPPDFSSGGAFLTIKIEKKTKFMRYCPKRVNCLSQCLFYFCYNMPGGAVNKYGYSTFCLRKALGVMPFSFRNTRLKLRMVPKPHCSATWVMGRLLPCSSAAAWLMRYWLIKS